jgi:hypothetical protein
MAFWMPPAKVTLPSEFEDSAAQSLWPALFEYNGHLPDGTQVLGYIITLPADKAGRRDDLTAVHEFDADGHHRSIRTRLVREGSEGPKADAVLHDMVAAYRAAGWRPGAIQVRPFLVEIDGWQHGFVFRANGEGLEDDDAEEHDANVYFMPFGFPFDPPYDSGSYST